MKNTRYSTGSKEGTTTAKTKNIGPIIKLDGEKEYKRAISDINSTMKLLNSEMKKSTTSFSGNTKSLKSLKEQAAMTSDKLDAQKDKVDVLRQAVKESAEKYGEADKRTKQWRTSLNNAETELLKTEKDLKELNAQTTGVGKLKTKFSEWKESISGIKDKLGSVTNGLKNVVSAGAKLAKTSFKAVTAGIAAVGTAAVAAGKKMFDAANATAEYGDHVDKMSQKMGISAKGYQEWDHVMQHCGTSMDTMKASMKTLANAAVNNNAAFDKLGISQKQLATMSQEEIFNATIAGLQNVTDTTERTYLAGKLLGKGATEMGAVLNMSAEDTAKMKQSLNDMGAVMSDKAVKASAHFKDSLQDLKTAGTGVKNTIVSELLPGISTLMEGLTGVLSGSADAKDKLLAGAKETVAGIKTILPMITEVLSSVIPAVAEIAPVVISELVNGLLANLDPLLKGAVTLITTLVSTLTDAKSIKLIIGAAVNCIVTLAEGLLDNIDQIIDSAFTIIDSLVNTLLKKNNLNKLIKASIQIVLKISSGIIQHVPDIIHAGLQLIKGLLSGVWNNRGMIFNAIKNIGKEIINAIKRILGIHSPSSVFSDIGKNLIRGLINGITNAERWVLDKIKGVGSKIVNWAKDALGIHSPSTKFKEIGDFTAQGFGIGFVGSMDKVRRQIVKAIPTSFDTNVGVNVGAAIAGGRASITPAASASGNVYNFKFDVTVNNNGGDAEDIAEDVSRQLFTQFKRRMEAFA